jgi:hypothetical protein
MSAPPGIKNRLPGNPNTFLLGGIIAGIVVLCGGLLVNSLITLNIVGRHAYYAFSTQRMTERERDRDRDRDRDTRPDSPGPVDDEDRGPFMAANEFLKDLLNRRFDKAYNRGTTLFKKDETPQQFRQRLEADKSFTQHNNQGLRRIEEVTKPGVLSRYDVFFRGPGGEGHYILDVRRDEDGSWRIDKFDRAD